MRKRYNIIEIGTRYYRVLTKKGGNSHVENDTIQFFTTQTI